MNLKEFKSPKRELEQYSVHLTENKAAFDYCKDVLLESKLEDWCAGTGTFSIYLANYVESLLLLEIDKDAANILEDNIRRNGIKNAKIEVVNVEEHKLVYDNVILNPPFGNKTKLLDGIIDALVRELPENIFILLPIDDLINVDQKLVGYTAIKYFFWNLRLGKTYEYHTREYYYVPCGFVHFQRGADSEDIVFSSIKGENVETVENKEEILKTHSSPINYLMSFMHGNMKYTIQGKDCLLEPSLEYTSPYKMSKDIVTNKLNIRISSDLIMKPLKIEIILEFISKNKGYEIVNEIPNLLIMEIFSIVICVILCRMYRNDEKDYSANEIVEKSNLELYKEKFNLENPQVEKAPKYLKSHTKFVIESMFRNKINKYLKMISELSSVQRSIVNLLEVSDSDSYEVFDFRMKSISSIAAGYIQDSLLGEIDMLVVNLNNLYEEHSMELKTQKLEARNKARKTFRQKRREYIKEFFTKLNITKIAGSRGEIRSAHTIESLIHFLTIYEVNPSLTDDDRVCLQDCREKLLKMREGGETESLSSIIISSVRQLEDMSKSLGSAEENFRSLVLKFKFTSNYQDAWNYALKLKGYIYECFFAISNGLLFTPESLKLSFADIIFLHANNLYDKFLIASGKVPQIRDYKPDFYLIKESTLRPGWAKWNIEWSKGSKTVSVVKSEDIQELLEFSNYSSKGSTMEIEDTTNLLRKLIQKCFDEGKGGLTVSLNNEESATSQTQTDKLKKIEKSVDQSPNLLAVIEVGYQTAAEDKSISDMNKWKPAQEICASLGLNLIVFTITDSTDTIEKTPWLRKDLRHMIHSSLPRLFARLTTNSPLGVGESAIADISSQKFRSLLKTGHSVKTPIVYGDIVESFSHFKDEIFTRPTGIDINETVQSMFISSLIDGMIISHEDYVDCMNELRSNFETISSIVDEGKMSVDILSEQNLRKYLSGCFSQCFESVGNNGNCGFVKTLNSKVLEYSKSKSASSGLKFINNLQVLKEEFHDSHNCDIRSLQTKICQTTYLINTICNTNTKIDQTSVFFYNKNEKNPLDILCSDPFSGKTAKCKDVKFKVLNIISMISGFSNGVIRDSKGLILSTYSNIKTKIENSAKSNCNDKELIKKYDNVLSKIDRVLRKKEGMLSSSQKALIELKDLLVRSKGDHISFHEMLLRSGCKSYIRSENLLKSYFELCNDMISEDPLLTILEDYGRKEKKFEENIDPRVSSLNNTVVSNYLSMVYETLKFGEFSNTEHYKTIIIEQVLNTIKEKYAGTIYDEIPEFVYRLIDIMLSVEFVRGLYILGKIAETFIVMTSEMTMSGFKLYRVKGTEYNLLVKVNQNKKTNCSCILLNLEYAQVSKNFILNRERATLLQSAFLCFTIQTLQIIQMQDCSSILLMNKTELFSSINKFFPMERDKVFKYLRELCNLNLKDAIDMMLTDDLDLSMCYKSASSEEKKIALVLRSVLTSITVILPCILQNNRKVSKMVQNIRHSAILATGRLGYLFEVGKKLEVPLRNIETIVLFSHIVVISYLNLSNFNEIQLAIESDRCNNFKKMFSYTIVGGRMKNERQFLYDIYICHFYNKEDCNYSEGSIRVLEEMGSKHIEWERAIKGSNEDSKNGYQKMRLLMGVRYISDTQKLLVNRRHVSSSDDDSPTNSISSNTSKKKSSDWTENKSSKHSGMTNKIFKTKKYGVSKKLLLSDLKSVCQQMKTITYGVPELIQVASEHCSSIYNDLVIGKAIRSKRNCEPITCISETTSIISQPREEFDLKKAVELLRSGQAIKIAKLVAKKNKLQISDVTEGKKFEKEIFNAMGMEGSSYKEVSEEIKNLIERYKKQKINWADAFHFSLSQMFDTDNMNPLFAFIKGAWKHFKRLSQNKPSEERINIARSMIVDHKPDNLRLTQFLTSFYEIIYKYLEYKDKTDKYPSVSFQEEEQEITQLEENLFQLYDNEICFLCLSCILCKFPCELNVLNNKNNAALLKLNQMMKEENKSSDLENLLKPFLTTEEMLMSLDREVIIGELLVDHLENFLNLIVFNIRRPTLTKILGIEKEIGSISELSKSVKRLIAKSEHKIVHADFTITVCDLIRGSILMARNILNRKDKGNHIPKSVRSKVIYEMLRKTKDSGTSNVQEMGFIMATDNSHRFFGSLAPKAQIGGDRDLLVNETKTKICIHITESFSKSLMESAVRNDGLTNKSLKEEILNTSISRMSQSSLVHGDTHRVDDEVFRTFYKVLNVIGDCQKWGPTHCTSYFSLMMQQLLKNFNDWSSYYKLIMNKSLAKRIEIPSASIEKIVRSFINCSTCKYALSIAINSNKYKELDKLLLKHCEHNFKNSDIIQFFVKYYLNKGKAYFQPYNHMGQGIHHATSSLLGNVCAKFIDDLISEYCAREFEGLNCEITHAGSSDDFCKCIVISGTVTEKEFRRLERLYDGKMKRIIDLMCGLMRGCQMVVSGKTVYSTVSSEFYSEFAFKDRKTPSPAKFILGQIINSSVTSPITLYQSIHVTAQQAMYMGISFLSIFALCLFKQLIFIDNSRDVYCKYGDIMLKGLSIIGRLYLPTYRHLTAISTTTEALEILYESSSRILTQQKVSAIDGVKNESPEPGIKKVFEEEDVESITSQITDLDDRSSDSRSTLSSLEKYTTSDLHVTSEKINTDIMSITDVLNLVFYKYYNQIESLEKNDNFDPKDYKNESMFADCFVQLYPESIRTQSKKLKEFRKKELKNLFESDDTSLKSLCEELIARNCITENYRHELSRLEQALKSKNVVWGLSGGIKGISLALHRQMLRAYLFKNEFPFDLQTWIGIDNSKYLADNNEEVPFTKRTKFTDVLDSFRCIKISYISEGKLSTNNELLSGNYVANITNDSLIIDLSKLEQFKTLIGEMLFETSGKTFNTIKQIEYNERPEFTPAPNIVTDKTSIWTTDRDNLMINNPNVVMAFILDNTSLYDSKPVGVEYSRLTSDSEILINNYSMIGNILGEIKRDYENNTPSMTEKKRYLNTISSLCRMISSSKRHKVSLYMFRGLKDSEYENNPRKLIKYSLVEGQQCITGEGSIVEFHNEIIYIIVGVISLISWLPVSDSEKTEILIRFLKSNMKNYKGHTCELGRMISEKCADINDISVMSIIYERSTRERNRGMANALRNLSQLPNNQQDIINKEISLINSNLFEFSGDTMSGNFSFTCEYGSATGIILNSKLYCTLSKPDVKILEGLERDILSKFNVNALDLRPGELHNSLLKILPTCDSSSKSPAGKNLYLVGIEKNGTIRLDQFYKITERKNKHFVFVSHSNLVTSYKRTKTHSVKLCLRWYRNKLIFGLESEALEVEPPKSFLQIKQMLKQYISSDLSEKYERRVRRNTKFGKICELKLQNIISLTSCAMLHVLLYHPNVQTLSIMRDGISSKSKLAQKIESAETVNLEERKLVDLYNIMNHFTNLSDVYNLNLIFGIAGIYNPKLKFHGIDESNVSETGNWSIVLSEEYNNDPTNLIIKNIFNLTTNHMTRSFFFLIGECEPTKGYKRETDELTDLIRSTQIFGTQLEFLVFFCCSWIINNLSLKITERNKNGFKILKSISESFPTITTQEVNELKMGFNRDEELLLLRIELKVDENPTKSVKRLFIEKCGLLLPSLLGLLSSMRMVPHSTILQKEEDGNYCISSFDYKKLSKSDDFIKLIIQLENLFKSSTSNVMSYKLIKTLCSLGFGREFDFSLLPKEISKLFRKQPKVTQDEIEEDDWTLEEFDEYYGDFVGVKAEKMEEDSDYENQEIDYDF